MAAWFMTDIAMSRGDTCFVSMTGSCMTVPKRITLARSPDPESNQVKSCSVKTR
jgi:hypothetical protein